MEHHVSNSPEEKLSQPSGSLTKGLITGGLILLLLIPTFFISGLVHERQLRQEEVVKEVSDKWAQAQTVSGPYLYIPYEQPYQNSLGKTISQKKYLILLPDELSVSGDILPEQRLRSIYKVLLYRANLLASGMIKLSLPKDIDPTLLLLSDARLCMGVSDFKGIEKKVSVDFNGKTYDLLPGLPVNDIDATGLSTGIDLSPAMLGTNISFKTYLQLKGSSYLHLAPLAGNSRFQLRSSWADPSFDGAVLPSERSVNKDGFTAKWEFSKANLPYGTQLQDTKINKLATAFGVSMLQTADQYAKTSRSVKYAILIIGLSFSLFFIIEIMQKKPMHPVQYVLIGLAMVIFYSLLLSISEFMSFDYAYLLAAFATIGLITSYTQAHFRKWKTASIFGLALTGLYGFIFVLISLEDTALLVGTISLFVILATVMYATRKISWYQTPAVAG
jgi:inner membrane protein